MRYSNCQDGSQDIQGVEKNKCLFWVWIFVRFLSELLPQADVFYRVEDSLWFQVVSCFPHLVDTLQISNRHCDVLRPQACSSGWYYESKGPVIVSVPVYSQLNERCGHHCLWETLWNWFVITDCLMEPMNQKVSLLFSLRFWSSLIMFICVPGDWEPVWTHISNSVCIPLRYLCLSRS